MRITTCLLIVASLLSSVSISYATRIKDITTLQGVRENQLVGYGLVVGLDGTGDRVNQTPFTQQSFNNMLMQFGIRLPVGANLQLKNVAAVAVSASLQPFAKPGQLMDVTVSSLGNAASLRGGQLIMTPLRGADGQVYAVAQGSVVVSGFGAHGNDGSKVIVNSTSTGRIMNGATVEKTIEMPFVHDGAVTFELAEPDFTTAVKIERAINIEFGRKVANALDANSVQVRVGDIYAGAISYKGEDVEVQERMNDRRLMSTYVPIISRIENLLVQPAAVSARVVINSRTGTIVVDQNVAISTVAVSHGNLSVVVSEKPFVSQPNAFASGKTVTGSASDININQQPSRAFVFSAGATLNDLVNAINNVGAAPGDIIAILEAIKAAGALHAEIEVI